LREPPARTFGDGLGDDPLDIGGLTRVDDRANLNVPIDRIANDQCLRLSHKRFDIGLGDRT
jgi:hypothetical protein